MFNTRFAAFAVAIAGMLAVAVPTAGYAGFDVDGRLNGLFPIRQAGQADGTNEGCLQIDLDVFYVEGAVSGAANGCDVAIEYWTPAPHKASSKALKSGKTRSSGKISQSVFSGVFIEISDPADSCADTLEMEGTVSGVEKCKVTASVKGDVVVGDNDNTESGKVTVTCDLGQAGANVDVDDGNPGIQGPTQAQIDTVLAAFESRKDVKGSNKGTLKIKMKGEPDSTPYCEI